MSLFSYPDIGNDFQNDGFQSQPLKPILVLGSASPARLKILQNAGVNPLVRVSEIDEDAILAEFRSKPANNTPASKSDYLNYPNGEQQVCHLAQAKATAVGQDLIKDSIFCQSLAPEQRVLVLGCDSMLEFADPKSSTGFQIFGKPHSREIAIQRWRKMRGNYAILRTGHAILEFVAKPDASGLSPNLHLEPGRSRVAGAGTTVHFANISDLEIAKYVDTGEPLEVAGAFTIDALGGWFIDSVEGDPHAVVGLSLPLLRKLLADLEIFIFELWR